MSMFVQTRPQANADVLVGSYPMDPDQPVDALISSWIGDYAAVWLMPKGERQNERLVSAILVAAIHAFPRHGPLSCKIRSRY